MGYRKPGSVVVQAEPSAHTVCGCSLGETAGVNSARGMDVILL